MHLRQQRGHPIRLLQVARQCIALESLLGEQVDGAALVMCRSEGPADEIAIDGWAELKGEVSAGLRGPSA